MKKTITFNATCRNCLHFEILGDDDNFLEDNQTYCKKTGDLKSDKNECKELELDLKYLKNVLRDFGVYNIKVELWSLNAQLIQNFTMVFGV